MQDRPTAEELIRTIAELLEDQLLPATEGPLKHPVRVAANLSRIIERELALGPAQDARERELLLGVLQQTDDGRDALQLAADLVRRLEADDLELERRTFPAVLEIVRGKLAIAKPGHDAYDFAPELDE
jgi:hypothetical protein